MNLAAEFAVVSDDLPLVEAAEVFSDGELELRRILPRSDDTFVLVLAMNAHTSALEAFEQRLAVNESVLSYDTFEAASDQRFYRVEMPEASFPLKAAFIELELTPEHGSITPEGWTGVIRVPDRRALIEFRTACENYGTFRLGKLVDANDRTPIGERLTEKQREALILAYREGYFDVPRAVQLTDLANALDISAPSLSARLRRAQRTIVEHTITDIDAD